VLGKGEFERRWPLVQRAISGVPVRFVLDYQSRDGPTHVSLNYVLLRLANGEVDGFVVVTNDVTRQKREELRVLEPSHSDALTGLLNRAGFEAHL
jgi:PAS domain-containing protein